jgi:hypothetical protein
MVARDGTLAVLSGRRSALRSWCTPLSALARAGKHDVFVRGGQAVARRSRHAVTEAVVLPLFARHGHPRSIWSLRTRGRSRSRPRCLAFSYAHTLDAAELRQRAVELAVDLWPDHPEDRRGAAELLAGLADWDPALLRRAMLGEAGSASAGGDLLADAIECAEDETRGECRHGNF